MTDAPQYNRSFEDDVIDRLARIETSAALNAAASSTALLKLTADHADHELRIRTVEGKQSRVLGISAAFAILSGFVTDIMYHFLKVHL